MNCRECSALLLVVLATSIYAQQNANEPTLKPRPASPAGPLAMDLQVVVTDKAENPQRGLQKSDFALLEDGHSVPIQAFEAADPSGAPKNPLQILLVIDEVNTPFVTVSTELTQLKSWIAQNHGQMAAPTSLVFFADGGLQERTQPTTDGTLLAATLERHEMHAMELRDLRKSNEWAGASEQLQKSVNALGSIAETEARVPGRKLLLWISPGWPLFAKTNTDYSPQQGRNIFSAIVNLANGLSQGDVVLYAVDPTGIADLGNREWETFLKPVRQSSSAQLADLGLQVLATQSGGRFVYGNNDLTEEITRCIRDGSAGYTLRFAPQRSQVSDTWHEIKVRVDKPGFIVRTRNGYYAEP